MTWLVNLTVGTWESCTAYLLTKETAHIWRHCRDFEVVTDHLHHPQCSQYPLWQKCSLFSKPGSTDISVALSPYSELHGCPTSWVFSAVHFFKPLVLTPRTLFPVNPHFFSRMLSIYYLWEHVKISAARPDKTEPCIPCPIEMAMGPRGTELSLGLGMFFYKRGQHLLSRQSRGGTCLHTTVLATQCPEAQGHENALFKIAGHLHVVI